MLPWGTQEMVEEQVNEVTKLNAIINNMEKEMMNLKEAYERQVELRNWTGLTLIDRNDELCILHEKENMQEQVIRRGEVELKKKEDEVRPHAHFRALSLLSPLLLPLLLCRRGGCGWR